MENHTLGQYLKLGAIIVGAVVVLYLIIIHPVLVSLEIIAAGTWFIGDYLVKN